MNRWLASDRQPRSAAPSTIVALLASIAGVGCTGDTESFDANDPARGPSDFVVLNGAEPTTAFVGGDDPLPAPRDVPVAVPEAQSADDTTAADDALVVDEALEPATDDTSVADSTDATDAADLPVDETTDAEATDETPGDEPATDPEPTTSANPSLVCDSECRAYCNALELENPVNRGLCQSLWGVGLATRPIIEAEACRRVYMDTIGRFPTHGEAQQDCIGQPWSAVVSRLLDTEEFVNLGRRHWADKLRYDNETVSIERIYDADHLARWLYEGELAFDQFAAIISAHPVLTRRFSTDGDRAEALFELFLGRPPFGAERTDIARLYHLWQNDYYDHPNLQMRLPDAAIRYDCVDENGDIDSDTTGECTSILFGFEQLILKPDVRAENRDGGRIMWAGLLSPDEWEKLQAPGRLLSSQRLFWEYAAAEVLEHYLGYNLAQAVPRVSEELVEYVLDYEGDIRALHFAVLTSAAYLQSSTGAENATLRWTYGPLKQAEAESWIDSLSRNAGVDLSSCDWRINRPRDFLDDANPNGISLVAESMWELNRDGTRVRNDYAELAQALGGCPDNSLGGRFKIVSVLTTVNQLNFVGEVCNPARERDMDEASAETLLPSGVSPQRVLDPDLAEEIFSHQIKRFFGRSASTEELEMARSYGEACALGDCTAEEFARPTCFAVLSSSEMLFY